MSCLPSNESQARKGGAIEVVVQGEETVSALQRVSANQEVREYATWAAASFPSPRRVRLKSAAGRPPNRFLQIPVNVDAGGAKE